MKGIVKDLLGFILIDIFLIVGMIWAFSRDYKMLGYGFLGYFVINTLAIVLKLLNEKKGGGGDGK